MDKDRDQMMNKQALSEMIKLTNLDIDELFKIMDGGKITIALMTHPWRMKI